MARRQPGSAFKPVVYLAALERGMQASDKILDAPVQSAGVPPGWPRNFKAGYLGPVDLRYAFAQSLNAATAQLANAVGPAKIIEVARCLGIKSNLRPDLSLARCKRGDAA